MGTRVPILQCPHVTIIGGGITGLAAAFYLQRHGRAQGLDVGYTVLEGSSRFGGKIVTDTSHPEFVVEGGPDSFITQKPWGTQLCHDLGLAERLIPTNDDQRNVFLLNQGRLVPFPGGFRLTVPTEFAPFVRTSLISPWGKIRMGLDLLIPRRTSEEDESLASFFRRRLGQEAVDKIAGPLMAGIYVADPERLSIQSTFPMFVEMERQQGSLIKALQRAKKQQPSKNGQSKPKAMFQSLRGGLSELVETLTRQLEGACHLNCQVTGIRYLSPGFEIQIEDEPPLTTDAVVLAIPAYRAARLVEPIAPQLATKLDNIRYVSSATISLGYRKDEVLPQHDLNGFGFLIPKSENRQLLACTWTSTKFNHRASADEVLLRAFVGGYAQESLVDLPDETLIALARTELAELMGITSNPIFQKIFRWPKGTPQYDVGHLDRVGEMERMTEKFPGLYLAGSAYRGVGLPDCVKSALTTVERLLIQLDRS